MRLNYILVDYESIQPAILNAPLHEVECIRLLIFVGANQHKLPFELASAVQALGSRADYVKIASIGPNALDFHIAYHMGHLAAQFPDAYFHIISKDKGFDPLITHLKEKKILAARWTDIAEVPLLKQEAAFAIEEKVGWVEEKLGRLNGSKPGKEKTLSSAINAWFQKKLPETEVQAIVKGLERKGLVQITENKVVYRLPSAQAGSPHP